jgi:DNA invertase Pin-like site-specific DNA recombinase
MPDTLGYARVSTDDQDLAGFTHEVPEVENYAGISNFKSSTALSGAAISKPRRVVVGRALLSERVDA